MSILQEAHDLITGDRAKSYGDSVTLHNRWSAILLQLGIDIAPQDLAMAMVVLKLLRESYAHKRDNVVDAAGYLELYSRQMEQ